MANSPVRIRDDLAVGPRSHPSAASESESVNCSSSPHNSCTHASAVRISGDSATDPSSENPPTEGGIRSREALSIRRDSATDPSSEDPPTEGEIRSREADSDTISIREDTTTDPTSSVNPPSEGGIRSTDVTPTVDVCVSTGDSARPTAANPVNNGKTDSPAGIGEARDSCDVTSGTGDSSEEESPNIRNIRG